MNKLVVSALLGAAVSAGLLLGKANLDKKSAEAALNSVRAEYTPEQGKAVCLAQRDGGEAYIILEADAESNVYRGVRALFILQIPFELPAKELNERPDLRKVNCETGE